MDFSALLNNSDAETIVSSQQMAECAVLLKASCTELINKFNSIARGISRTADYWESSTAKSVREENKLNNENIDEINRKFKNQIEKLNLIIELYKGTEQANVDIISELPDSVIS